MKVAVIDDHSVFRIGVVSALQSEAAIEIVGEGGSADEAIRIVGEASPDVMLLDIGLPGGGLEAARRIASDFPSVKLIMLTVSDAPGDITNAFAFGAVGYLLKGISSSDLVTAIRQAYQGGTVLAPVLAGRLFGRLAQRLARDRGQDPLHNMLTPREFEVLTLVGQGLSNKVVAYKLGISERSVKNKMTSIMQKLGVTNRVEAALHLNPIVH